MEPDPVPVVPEPEPVPPIIDNGTVLCTMGCEEGVTDTGERTVVFEDDDPQTGVRSRVEAVLPENEGDPLRHRVSTTRPDGIETVTEAATQLPGAAVTIEKDAAGRPQVVTMAVLGDGVILEAVARADGSAEHRVLVVTASGKLVETVAGTSIPEAFTELTVPVW